MLTFPEVAEVDWLTIMAIWLICFIRSLFWNFREGLLNKYDRSRKPDEQAK
jgi:hypothetical protein